jgi:hypothetical protein
VTPTFAHELQHALGLAGQSMLRKMRQPIYLKIFGILIGFPLIAQVNLTECLLSDIAENAA